MKIMNEIDKFTYKEDGGAKRRYMEMERIKRLHPTVDMSKMTLCSRVWCAQGNCFKMTQMTRWLCVTNEQ